MFRRRQFHTKPTASDSLVGGAKTLRDTKEEENEEKEGRDRAVGFQFKEVGTLANRAKNPVVFLDVSIGGVPARLTFELRKDIVPRTAENFRSICAGDRADTQDGTRLSYQGCVFHRVIKDFAVIGGDIASDTTDKQKTFALSKPTKESTAERWRSSKRHDGTGRASIYGGHFADENFVLRHTGPGVLTCCNAGPDTNSSAFMITTVEAPWLNGRSVAFGCLANAESFDALEKLEACGVEGGRPSVYIQASYTKLPAVGADDLALLPCYHHACHLLTVHPSGILRTQNAVDATKAATKRLQF
ncbi:conserved unknown protein [Ectocarpus siliculosus]|uniref:PPIase cyclophilin-type domain-containing protein n=1 Tax=Ectocarpus siliculosus TaxID=2880 RepID=D7G1E7_ECTSI|nr:conserved unknown protein [Ectocarpus siliculosus]|eukprot:CBJ26755.1 conserved unknown protein [Ectocarpus siliculosus]